ncbi:MAG: BMC domain-containing protein [Myxococcales bacterium]|nr:BMC domain-containing protein [Myxococcales bacterium]
MSEPAIPRGPALGVLELSSIARGVVAIDAALKRSPALLVTSRAVSAGKHLACFEGGVAEVQEAMAAGRAAAGKLLLDDVELALADLQVWPMLAGLIAPADWTDDAGAEAVAIVETSTVCAAIRAADAACKVADVVVRDVRLALDLAGKAYFTMTGTLDSVAAAAEAATAAAASGPAGPAGLVLLEVIAQPSPDLRGRLFR